MICNYTQSYILIHVLNLLFSFSFVEIEVYRLTRPKENPDQGLCAKNMNSKDSIFQHVANGSSNTSRFISTCGTLEAAHCFRSMNQHNGFKNGPIVKITISDLSSMIFYDLRTFESRQSFLQDVDVMNLKPDLVTKFHNFANKYQEVLIQDYVPSAYIEVLKD